MSSDGAASLLLEIGCEELPPRAVDLLRDVLFKAVADGAERAGLPFDRSASRSFSTPRRLALRLCNLATKQPDQALERRGPAVEAAFDEEGNPTQAALGFARSVGLEVKSLTTVKSEKGEWLFCEQRVEGKPVSSLIFEILEAALKQLPVPRPMRWADYDFTFVRPVHWVVLLHGEDVIEGTLLGQATGSTTRGHRVHAPGPHEIPSADHYEQILMDARVIVDPVERRGRIVDHLRSTDEHVMIEDDLLDEVNNLVEWPVVLSCRFDEEFLEIPHEALIASMQDHQKFFPIRAESDDPAKAKIKNAFLVVSNIESTDPAMVQDGFERVIRPRLADARFFFEQDKKEPLAAYGQLLDQVIFQEKIGTVGDKTRRITDISQQISEFLNTDPTHTKRAAELCKCDLMTLMVGEFPELQGTMGGYYAAASGEPDPVARAIGEHYAPRFSGDEIPATSAGRLLSIADRADTLVGVFAAGLRPTGRKDPYALRRAALGMVRILSEARVPIPLDQLLDWAAGNLKEILDCSPDVLAEVRDFVVQRARSHYREQGLDTQLISAALESPWTHWPDLDARIGALRGFMGREEAESLAAANKRIGNILRKAQMDDFGVVRESSLKLDEERALFREIESASEDVAPLLETSDYAASLARLSALREPVDLFFDTVLVMDEDDELRRNRLALLNQLKSQFDAIADLSILA